MAFNAPFDEWVNGCRGSLGQCTSDDTLGLGVHRLTLDDLPALFLGRSLEEIVGGKFCCPFGAAVTSGSESYPCGAKDAFGQSPDDNTSEPVSGFVHTCLTFGGTCASLLNGGGGSSQ